MNSVGGEVANGCGRIENNDSELFQPLFDVDIYSVFLVLVRICSVECDFSLVAVPGVDVLAHGP